MAEFDKDGEWHKRRCPQRNRLALCWGGMTWTGDSAENDYGPRREFVGRTCAEVFAEEEREFERWHAEYHAAGNVMGLPKLPMTLAVCLASRKGRWLHGPIHSWDGQERRTCRSVWEEQRRAAAAPAEEPEEWRVVTEGLTDHDDRCAAHDDHEFPTPGVEVRHFTDAGCVIERRVAPAAAPEAAAPAEQVVGVKAWSLTLDRAADAADATGFAMLAVKQPDWIPYKPTPDAARDLWEALDPQYAEDAALGRLMRTVQERWRGVSISDTMVVIDAPGDSHLASVSDHGGSILKALAFAAGRSVLATPHVPQYANDAALAEREARLAEARAGLATARAMNAEGGAK